MTPDQSPIEAVSTDIESPVKSESQLPVWAESAQTRITYVGPIEKPISKPEIKVSESPLTQATLPNLGIEKISPALSSAERDLHRWCSGEESVSPLDEPEPSPLDIELTDVPEMVPLSQFADSYILAQGEDELFIIDQHALHERVRYERLRDNMVSWESQELVSPLPLGLSSSKTELLHGHQSQLNELGFSFDAKLNLTAVPQLLLGSEKIEGFISDVLSELESGAKRLDTVENLADEVAFMKSCRGAVKANQKLSLPEMRRLLADMQTIENPWACVHGRPTVLRMSLNRLDGHFGRHG